MKTYSKHFYHYLTLFGILAAGVLALVLFSYDLSFQVGVVIATAVAYVAWGIVHHYIHHDLYLEVVIEYLVIASLGLVVVFSLLFRT